MSKGPYSVQNVDNFQDIFARNKDQGFSGAYWNISTEEQRMDLAKFSYNSDDSSEVFKCVYKRRRAKWVKTYNLKFGQNLRKYLGVKNLASNSDSALSSCENYIMNDKNEAVVDYEVIE